MKDRLIANAKKPSETEKKHPSVTEKYEFLSNILNDLMTKDIITLYKLPTIRLYLQKELLLLSKT